ncbi:50S ribosomal protein L10, chloroplastic [Glycine soja]
MKGMNVWLFVHTEEIPSAIKPYWNFQKEKKLEDNDFTGAVFEGKFYGPDEVKNLESLPTRAEIYATLLGALKSPASALVATLQAPARELVTVLKAHIKNLEEQQGVAQQIPIEFVCRTLVALVKEHSDNKGSLRYTVRFSLIS